MRWWLVLMLVLAACSKRAAPRTSTTTTTSAILDAGSQDLSFGGGSFGDGTSDLDGGLPKNGQDPATMTSGSAGHTFAQ